MPKHIPDRWRDYSSCNWTPIENQRILLFKTPLAQKYSTSSPSDNGIEEDERFTPMDLIEQLAERGMKLGIVLDFTYTTRYYDFAEFTDKGIIYKKLMCPGHVIPKNKFIKKFQDEVKSFLQSDQTGSLIGVHCTHGVNRTGYMVCRYLIDCCGYEPEDAIAAVNKARGHPIERVNYLEDLKSGKRDMTDVNNDDEEEDSDYKRHDSNGYRHNSANMSGRPDWSRDRRQDGDTYRESRMHSHPSTRGYNSRFSSGGYNSRYGSDNRRNQDYTGSMSSSSSRRFSPWNSDYYYNDDRAKYHTRGRSHGGHYDHYDRGYHSRDSWESSDDRSWKNWDSGYGSRYTWPRRTNDRMGHR